MQEPKRQLPFKVLGKHLKFIREERRESLAEVAGAVEISPDTLERIEYGEERPAEDILMLLINHFDMQDHEAVQLWESAGYSKGDRDDRLHRFDDLNAKATLVLFALDVRTMYSDGIEVTDNEAGIVMNFTQGGNQQQSMPVARVGMSYDQAERVLKTLQQAILRGKYLGKTRLLPPGSDK